MSSLQRYTSPDRLLTFIVQRDSDGDISLGFEGCSWHTHADILATLSGLPQDQALAQFLHDLFSNVSIIATLRIDGGLQDTWITEDPRSDGKYQAKNETLEFRTWDGSPWNPA